ncbi:MAG: calcium-binding protein [Pseudanabaena sp.]|nr:calcium-binding protein [Microcystis sp. M49629_WE12]
MVYEIEVDVCDEAERAMGWYYYLENKITFPFLAKWKKKAKKIGLIIEKEVEVLGMASEEDRESNIYVELAYTGEQDDTFIANLSDIEAINLDPDTKEAIAD